MATESVYKIVEIVGTSPTSWSDAAQKAVTKAKSSLHDLRIGEVKAMDVRMDADGNIITYRVKMDVSFKLDA